MTVRKYFLQQDADHSIESKANPTFTGWHINCLNAGERIYIAF
jgi:hypothetical protein